MNRLFAGIEAGGTKFVCAIGDVSGKIGERVVIPTTTPEETMGKVIEFFRAIHSKTPLSAIGVASFGPIDPAPNSPYFGYITTAPKPGWGHFNIVGSLKMVFDLPIGFDTDVNGAAIGEARWGNGQGFDTLVYWTVGTGIGAGGMVSGQLIHGLIHPEMGHTFVPQDKNRDPFKGVCPFHGNCLEGLATGPAIEERWQVKSATRDLPPEHPAWDLEAEYLSYAMANCIMTLSPQRIIIGGGVMNNKDLYGIIHEKTVKLLNGYIKHKAILEDISDYIVPPGLKDNSGICGAIALAEQSFYSGGRRTA
jgi:fructokinase